MVRSRLLALPLVPLAFVLMGGAAPIPLTDPAPLAAPAGLGIEQVGTRNLLSDAQRELRLLTLE